ncbi:MAG: response regulator transcription factor [Bacillota bacterium]|nr:response regulator transcription factor [Bacillota bacterium]
MRFLLIEDDQRLSDALQMLLQDYKYSVDTAFDGNSGQDMAESGIYDIIILDRMLPGKEGVQVLRDLRKKGINTPVLLLTARDSIEDRVEGLDAGADDYLVKPFATKELLARIRALLRRQPDQVQTEKLSIGSLELDTLRCEATNGKEIIKLTLKESQLLEFFIKRKGQVVTKDQILDKVWGLNSAVEMNNIEIYIHYLRKKLDPINYGIQIETIRGMGYCLGEVPDVS